MWGNHCILPPPKAIKEIENLFVAKGYFYFPNIYVPEVDGDGWGYSYPYSVFHLHPNFPFTLTTNPLNVSANSWVGYKWCPHAAKKLYYGLDTTKFPRGWVAFHHTGSPIGWYFPYTNNPSILYWELGQHAFYCSNMAFGMLMFYSKIKFEDGIPCEFFEVVFMGFQSFPEDCYVDYVKPNGVAEQIFLHICDLIGTGLFIKVTDGENLRALLRFNPDNPDIYTVPFMGIFTAYNFLQFNARFIGNIPEFLTTQAYWGSKVRLKDKFQGLSNKDTYIPFPSFRYFMQPSPNYEVLKSKMVSGYKLRKEFFDGLHPILNFYDDIVFQSGFLKRKDKYFPRKSIGDLTSEEIAFLAEGAYDDSDLPLEDLRDEFPSTPPYSFSHFTNKFIDVKGYLYTVNGSDIHPQPIVTARLFYFYQTLPPTLWWLGKCVVNRELSERGIWTLPMVDGFVFCRPPKKVVTGVLSDLGGYAFFNTPTPFYAYHYPRPVAGTPLQERTEVRYAWDIYDNLTTLDLKGELKVEWRDGFELVRLKLPTVPERRTNWKQVDYELGGAIVRWLYGK